jgi:hypothetical protein
MINAHPFTPALAVSIQQCRVVETALIELLSLLSVAARVEQRCFGALEEGCCQDVINVRPHPVIAQKVAHPSNGRDVNVVDRGHPTGADPLVEMEVLDLCKPETMRTVDQHEIQRAGEIVPRQCEGNLVA